MSIAINYYDGLQGDGREGVNGMEKGDEWKEKGKVEKEGREKG